MGQIYVLAKPLLRRPLMLEHLEPRLLGRTTPRLNFIYARSCVTGAGAAERLRCSAVGALASLDETATQCILSTPILPR